MSIRHLSFFALWVGTQPTGGGAISTSPSFPYGTVIKGEKSLRSAMTIRLHCGRDAALLLQWSLARPVV